ncbi:NAD-dependent epimerase/dehydratase family protein [Vineibacter terrae]|uniref:NAD-dependent epimerase/dehydratase family protein n=1 Tax=Vineibacter terrae TaxID=2586908 RepID=UPI002E2EB605|nr:NAD-dependent epimerase/dehydratase family protein [Vineibacter terrae]HEX2891794.1 NAD-dependent epimerase/dehydratase family protein [Vineibacter terrae]
MTRTALVVGDGGVVGHRLASYLAATGAWRVIGIGRRPQGPPGATHLALDMLDRDALLARAPAVAGVTHAFLTAKAPAADAAAEAALNARLLHNMIDMLEAGAAGLQHVALVHGTKWYGCHAGPYAVPAREDDPRGPAPLFYFDQHDALAARQHGRPWGWSTLRPHTVWGYSRGTGNNLVTLIGVYAALLREAGEKLAFPGTPQNYEKQSQATTADLLGQALAWTATAPSCRNQDLNLTNGATFRWRDLWPAVAAFFGMEPGPPASTPLTQLMPRYEPLWPRIQQKHGLAEGRLEELVSWQYGQGLFSVAWDDGSSNAKARRLGFAAQEDNRTALLRILGALRRDRIVP